MSEESRLHKVREMLIAAVQAEQIGGRVTWRGVRVDKPAADFEVELGEHSYSITITEEW